MGKANRLKQTGCILCGEYCGKRKVCLDCKNAYPPYARTKGGTPFERRKDYEKNSKQSDI